MNPSPLVNAFHVITRALALAFVGFFTTISPLAVVGGLVLMVAVVAAAVVVIVLRFDRMTRTQRLDFIELVRALRQSGK